MKVTRFSRSTVSALLGLVLTALLFSGSPTWAIDGGNEASDLVAPYGYLAMSAGSAPGPLTTHYLISSTTGLGATVNVKCYNDQIQRVGNPAGTTVTLAAFAMEPWDPVSLGLIGDPLFTGLGFCYFAEAGGGDDFAVSFLVGISDGNNLITTNNAVAITADTAQSNVTDDDANIPYWTEEGSWDTYVLLVSPKATGSDLDMRVYDAPGTLLGTYSAPGFPGLAPRDLDMASIAGEIPLAAGGWGHADLDAAGAVGFGYMGWVIGLNNTSLQAFMYPIPLDTDDTAPLSGSDRP